jgi:hypothetical protein
MARNNVVCAPDYPYGRYRRLPHIRVSMLEMMFDESEGGPWFNVK